MPTRPEISVVICTYDRAALLDAAIASVLDQSLAPERYEVVVVDNSSDQPAAARRAEAYARRARLRYRLEPVPGLSNARNVGVAASAGAIVAFIDDDARATRGWLEALLAAHAAFPDAAAVGGRVTALWPEPRPDWLHDDLLQCFSVVDWGGGLGTLGEHEWLAGTNISYRRDALLAAGGFSTALGRRGADNILLSNEENELVARIAAGGRRAVYAPDAVVEHRIDPARLTQTWVRRRMAWQAVSDSISGVAAALPPAALAERLGPLAAAPDAGRPGFYAHTADAERFRDEVFGVYHLVLALLAGGLEARRE